MADTVSLFYRTLGTGSPLIILHGLFGSSDNWLGMAKQLAERHTVYLLDLRNHGQSPHAAEHNYTALAGDVAAFIEAHALSNISIIGHSMGGKTLMKLLMIRPDLDIVKAVVVDIGPQYYSQHHQVILEALHSVKLETLQNRQEADAVMADLIVESDVRQFLLKNLYRKDIEGNANGHFSWRMNLSVLTDQIENIGEGTLSNEVYDKPILFIKGAYSNYIRGGDEVKILQHFPKARIEVVQSGHWVQAENPKGFLLALESFGV